MPEDDCSSVPYSNKCRVFTVTYQLKRNRQTDSWAYGSGDRHTSCTSGRMAGLKLAKSVRRTQFQLVSMTFSDLMSPWQTCRQCKDTHIAERSETYMYAWRAYHSLRFFSHALLFRDAAHPFWRDELYVGPFLIPMPLGQLQPQPYCAVYFSLFSLKSDHTCNICNLGGHAHKTMHATFFTFIVIITEQQWTVSMYAPFLHWNVKPTAWKIKTRDYSPIMLLFLVTYLENRLTTHTHKHIHTGLYAHTHTHTHTHTLSHLHTLHTHT